MFSIFFVECRLENVIAKIIHFRAKFLLVLRIQSIGRGAPPLGSATVSWLTGLQGEAKKWTPNVFTIFSTTVWDFNIKIYSFIY